MSGIKLSTKKEKLKVNGNEIREKVQANNKKISRMFDQIEIFKLNVQISNLMEENKKLQKICEESTRHSFDANGICRFCGVER